MPRLEYLAAHQVQPEIHWYQASLMGSGASAQALHDFAMENNDQHWLNLLAKNGVAASLFQKAVALESPSEKRRLLKAAANQGYAPALHELGLMEHASAQKIKFLTAAAELDYVPAQKALYQWYWLHREYEAALPWLTTIAQSDPLSALKLALYLWRFGEKERGLNWFEQAQLLGSTEATDYLALIRNHWQQPQIIPQTLPKDCKMTLQFVAGSLDSLQQAKAFYQRFIGDETMQDLPICINPPYWLDEDDFVCDSRPANGYRISCRLAALDGHLAPSSFSHLVVFSDHGKANVVNGIMYLDLADRYSVFIHELAHFVGFIDEYPLSPEFANYYCAGEQSFPNLAIVAEDESIADLDLDYWQSLSHEISVSKASTCTNHPAQAYKFSSKMTFMEFHDTGYIPTLYKNIWKDQLNANHALRIAAINIAQSLEEVGNTPAAQKWWDVYEQWRTSGELNSDPLANIAD